MTLTIEKIRQRIFEQHHLLMQEVLAEFILWMHSLNQANSQIHLLKSKEHGIQMPEK